MYASLPLDVQEHVLQYLCDRTVRYMYEVAHEPAQMARSVLRKRIARYRAQYAADKQRCRATLTRALDCDDARVVEIAARLAASAPQRYFSLQDALACTFPVAYNAQASLRANDNALRYAVRAQAHQSLAVLLRVGCEVCPLALQIALRQPLLRLHTSVVHEALQRKSNDTEIASEQALIVQNGVATLRVLLDACAHWQTLAARINLVPLEYVFSSEPPFAQWALAASEVILMHATGPMHAPPLLCESLHCALLQVYAANNIALRQKSIRALAVAYQYVVLYRRHAVGMSRDAEIAAQGAAQLLRRSV